MSNSELSAVIGHQKDDARAVVQALEHGDRAYIQLPSLEGNIRWNMYWVTESGSEYAILGESRRVKIVDSSEAVLGVELAEKHGDEFISEDWTPSLNSIERVPSTEFDNEKWYQWEVRVSETEFGGVSTDQTVFPEASCREDAVERAKRWAEMESGYAVTVYQDGLVRR